MEKKLCPVKFFLCLISALVLFLSSLVVGWFSNFSPLFHFMTIRIDSVSVTLLKRGSSLGSAFTNLYSWQILLMTFYSLQNVRSLHYHYANTRGIFKYTKPTHLSLPKTRKAPLRMFFAFQFCLSYMRITLLTMLSS